MSLCKTWIGLERASTHVGQPRCKWFAIWHAPLAEGVELAADHEICRQMVSNLRRDSITDIPNCLNGCFRANRLGARFHAREMPPN